MKKLEEIPGFEKTPELTEKKACTKIYKIAGAKTFMNMNKETAVLLKKLLDDRRELLEMTIKLFKAGWQGGSINFCDFYDLILKVTKKTYQEL